MVNIIQNSNGNDFVIHLQKFMMVVGELVYTILHNKLAALHDVKQFHNQTRMIPTAFNALANKISTSNLLTKLVLVIWEISRSHN